MHYTDLLSTLSSEMGGPGFLHTLECLLLCRVLVTQIKSMGSNRANNSECQAGEGGVNQQRIPWSGISSSCVRVSSSQGDKEKKDGVAREAAESWDKNGLPSQQEPWSGRKPSVLTTRYLATSRAPARVPRPNVQADLCQHESRERFNLDST